MVEFLAKKFPKNAWDSPFVWNTPSTAGSVTPCLILTPFCGQHPTCAKRHANFAHWLRRQSFWRFRLKWVLITSVSGPTENVWIAPTNMGGKTIFRWAWRPQGTVCCCRRPCSAPNCGGKYSCPHLLLDSMDFRVYFFLVKALYWVLGARSLWIDNSMSVRRYSCCNDLFFFCVASELRAHLSVFVFLLPRDCISEFLRLPHE